MENTKSQEVEYPCAMWASKKEECEKLIIWLLPSKTHIIYPDGNVLYKVENGKVIIYAEDANGKEHQARYRGILNNKN